MPGANDLEAAVEDQVTQLHRSLSSRGPDESETQLVDGQSKVVDFVEGEAEPARQTGSGDAGQAQEFSGGRNRQPDFVTHTGRRYQSMFATSGGARLALGWSEGRASETIAPMNVAVCVKQIPDPAMPGQLDANNFLKREGKLILDDSDAYGVEMALQLVDKAGGGEVTLISMAPNSEVSGLRTALAMGAHKAILISDDTLKGTDALERPRSWPLPSGGSALTWSSPPPSRPTATPALRRCRWPSCSGCPRSPSPSMSR